MSAVKLVRVNQKAVFLQSTQNNHTAWLPENMPDLEGRVAIITGGNSGIGFETARALAARKAQVILAVRNNDKGATAVHQILKQDPKSVVAMRCLNLASLESIREFARDFQRDFNRLDLLINNAGVMALPRRTTLDGFEMQFGTNHLGHFALTGLLLSTLLNTPGSRVITVSSRLHVYGEIQFDDLMGEVDYDKNRAYSQSKLANLLFAYELQRRLARAGAATISLAVHPGYAATNLQTAGPQMEGSQVGTLVMRTANALFAQSAARGALPILYAATHPEMQGGEFIGPDGLLGMRGDPQTMTSSPKTYDEEAAGRLWEISAQLTGVHYQVLQFVREPAAG
jgi:NAD(P)-dependent dehydrogenase (short-subunit alcohol dehydrogenase family)